MSHDLTPHRPRVPSPLHDAQFEVGVIPPAERRCQNCQTPMQGPYCFQCGQHEKSSIRHFGLFVRDVIDDVLNLDSRAVRTLKPLLFSPGFLTKEYLQGRRMRYVPPLRLYVIASLVFFFVLGTVVPDEIFKITFDNINRESADEIAKSLVAMEVAPEFDPVRQDPKMLELLALAKQQEKWSDTEREQFARDMRAYVKATQAEAFRQAIQQVAEAAQDAEEANAAVDAQEQTSSSTDQVNRDIAPGAPPTMSDKEQARIQQAMARAQKAQDLAAQIKPPTAPELPTPPVPQSTRGRITLFGGLSKENNPWLFSLQERMNTRWTAMQNHPEQIRDNVFRLLPQSMFIMLPLFALVLKMFFPFSNRLYAEHLVTAVHSHSFMFFLISLLVTLTYTIDQLGALHDHIKSVGSIVEWVVVAGWIWIPVYLFRMQHTVYGQGFFITWLKFTVIGILYVTLLALVISVDFLISLL